MIVVCDNRNSLSSESRPRVGRSKSMTRQQRRASSTTNSEAQPATVDTPDVSSAIKPAAAAVTSSTPSNHPHRSKSTGRSLRSSNGGGVSRAKSLVRKPASSSSSRSLDAPNNGDTSRRRPSLARHVARRSSSNNSKNIHDFMSTGHKSCCDFTVVTATTTSDQISWASGGGGDGDDPWFAADDEVDPSACPSPTKRRSSRNSNASVSTADHVSSRSKSAPRRGRSSEPIAERPTTTTRRPSAKATPTTTNLSKRLARHDDFASFGHRSLCDFSVLQKTTAAGDDSLAGDEYASPQRQFSRSKVARRSPVKLDDGRQHHQTKEETKGTRNSPVARSKSVGRRKPLQGTQSLTIEPRARRSTMSPTMNLAMSDFGRRSCDFTVLSSIQFSDHTSFWNQGDNGPTATTIPKSTPMRSNTANTASTEGHRDTGNNQSDSRTVRRSKSRTRPSSSTDTSTESPSPSSSRGRSKSSGRRSSVRNNEAGEDAASKVSPGSRSKSKSRPSLQTSSAEDKALRSKSKQRRSSSRDGSSECGKSNTTRTVVRRRTLSREEMEEACLNNPVLRRAMEEMAVSRSREKPTPSFPSRNAPELMLDNANKDSSLGREKRCSTTPKTEAPSATTFFDSTDEMEAEECKQQTELISCISAKNTTEVPVCKLTTSPAQNQTDIFSKDDEFAQFVAMENKDYDWETNGGNEEFRNIPFNKVGAGSSLGKSAFPMQMDSFSSKFDTQVEAVDTLDTKKSASKSTETPEKVGGSDSNGNVSHSSPVNNSDCKTKMVPVVRRPSTDGILRSSDHFRTSWTYGDRSCTSKR